MILQKQDERETPRCNCKDRKTCPLPQKCTIRNVVYEEKLETTNKTQTYIGLTSNTFKTRFSQHS